MKIKIRQSDKLFSNYIREKAGWKCERCGAQFTPPTSGLHASHFWGRSHENTRHDQKNVFAICFGCHNYFHANPQEHAEWVEQKIGKEEFRYLRIRANLYKKRDDKQDVMYIKELIKQQKGE